MYIRGILAAGTIVAIVILVWGMLATPSDNTATAEATAPVSDQTASAILPASAPLQQYSFANYGFSIQAPEDWRTVTEAEQSALAEQVGDSYVSEDTIIALTPDIPNGPETAMVMIDTLQDTMDGESLSALNTFSLALTGLDWVTPSSWTGKKWTRVTTQPYKHEIAGFTAATIGISFKHDSDQMQNAQLKLTFVELPGEAISMGGIMTNDAFRNREVDAILKSLTVIPKQ